MMTQAEPGKRTKSLDSLRKLTANPLKLRALLSVVLLAGWYFAAYSPLTARIDETKQLLSAERERRQLRREIEDLRRDLATIEPRLPPTADRNAWVQFLMEGIRAHPVRLSSLDPGPTVDVGPYKAAVVTVSVEGTFDDQARLLRWIETIPRLHRVNSLSLGLGDKSAGRAKPGQAPKEPEVQMRLVLMGILG